MRCAQCGAEIAKTASGRLVHIDAIPKGHDPHDAVDGGAEFDSRNESRRAMREAMADLILHHRTMCPASSCEFVRAADRALRLG